MKIANRRVKTPTLLQMEAVECGAAALGIILAHHGKWRPLEELRTECGVSRDGSKAKNILFGARRYGLKAKGRKAQVETALNTPFPFIAFWNFNHFLVVEGYRNGTVYLNDPATGPRTVSLEDFDNAFTGVILVFEKDEGFTKDPKPPGVLSRLLPRTRPIRTAIMLSVLISLTLVIPGLAVPGFSKVFVDEVLINSKDDWLVPLLFFMAGTAVVTALLTWLQQAVLLRTESKLALAASARFVWHLLRLPVDFFNQRHPGDISNRIDANDRIAASIAGDLGESIVSVIRVGFYGAVMLFFDWVLALAAMSLSLTNILVFQMLMRRRADASLRVQQEYGQFQSSSVTGIQAIETLKATGTDDDYFERWSGFQAKHLNNQRRLGLYGIVANAFPPLLDGLTLAIVLGLGGYRIMQGEMTIGTLVAFQALIQNFSGPINALVATAGAIQELNADLVRTDDVAKQAQDQRYRERPAAPATRLSGRIELRDVTFGYSRLEAPLIENFNLTIESGARVALVGGSGSGKSTIAKLMTGLYRPWSGEILYDGVPLDEHPVSTLTQSVASVSQEIILFGGTVRDNLSAWDEHMPDEDMLAALRDARILDVISGRGGALDAEVDEGGANFSGGQAQRIEIARALSGDPSILILDEATSALDATTEGEIDVAIRRRGCTCVIVAHRLSTIRDADEIVVLNFGEVVERGNHDELVAAGGPYAQLIAQG
ncbi:NHLP family bacteriocin export ABC transporter peptidase/permease/ATPase subunit [Nisaea sp.]|uniref:NHLP family bacteriocin export ABC transporter peptidase/permease/ATPase subunit n=1 Tax=Nisaea sp. TaxID=2024842 RepID=UPI003B529A86